MTDIIPTDRIENKILFIRGQKVILDRNLAEFYGVETRVFNQAVKRNKERFPKDFMFQLLPMETESLVSQNVISSEKNVENKEKTKNLKSQSVISSWGGRRKLPYVFTEQGVAMLSSVLKSKRAIEINILIMRAFVQVRKLVYSYKDLADKIKKMEMKYNGKIADIYRVLDLFNKDEKNKKEIARLAVVAGV